MKTHQSTLIIDICSSWHSFDEGVYQFCTPVSSACEELSSASTSHEKHSLTVVLIHAPKDSTTDPFASLFILVQPSVFRLLLENCFSYKFL
jgi:hypothetical protein